MTQSGLQGWNHSTCYLVLAGILLLSGLPAAVAAEYSLAANALVIGNDNFNVSNDIGDYKVKDQWAAWRDPRAGDPDYFYLVRGVESVCLQGPDFTSNEAEALFRLQSQRIEYIDPQEHWATGIRVVVNERLEYRIEMENYEYEIDVARIVLIKDGLTFIPHFLLIGTGDGVAHQVTINYFVDGSPPALPPVSRKGIESRTDDGTVVNVEYDDNNVCQHPESADRGPHEPSAGKSFHASLVCLATHPVGIASAVVAVIGLAAAFQAPPVRRAALRFLPLLSFFSRVEKHRVLDHPLRNRILASIEAEPGIHFLELQRRTGVSRGSLDHHLRKLVQLGLVTAEVGTGYTCYFPKGTVQRSLMRAAPVLKAPMARDILAQVAAEPGVSPLRLASTRGMSLPGIHYHLQRLEETGLIQIARGEHRFRLFATPTGVTALSPTTLN